MRTRRYRFTWLVTAAVLFALCLSGCGGGAASDSPDYIPFLPHGFFYIDNVTFPDTLEEGQPLELQITVNLPDDQSWISRAENDRGREAMFIDINIADEGSGQYRLILPAIRVPWPGRQWKPEDLNVGPFTQFEWRFPEDFLVQGRNADGDHFDGDPLLPPGTYEVWILSGDPPVGSFGDWTEEYFGSFEVVPAEGGGS